MLIRLFDILISLFLILILSPLYIIISIIIFLQMDGPLFFVQNRVTINQKLFRFVKFRSMVSNSKNVNTGDSKKYLKISLNELRSIRNKYKTTKSGDSRITIFGNFLRKSSLDEIPQFFSVLIGDMSLVGPRPDPPIQRADYEETEWIQRCSVKSGITGISQISGRSQLKPKDRILNDLYWVNNISFGLYIKTLILTPMRMFKNVR